MTVPLQMLETDSADVNFEGLTIRNLPNGNSLLWVHTGVAVIFLILTIILLRRHTSQVQDRSREKTTNTLFVRSVPKTATVEDINAHFIEAYPTCEVTAVTLGYDVNKLMSIDQDRIKAGEHLHYYKSIPENSEKPRKVNPRVCGQLRCCCSSQEVDAIEFYRNKEQHLLDKMREELEKELPRPLGMAFVTFKTNAMAKQVLKDFNAVKCKTFFCGRRPKSSSKSEGLKVKNWRVKFATFARSINWKNLSVQRFKWFGRFLLVNLALLALVTFLTTPSMNVNALNSVTVPLTNLMVPILSQFFPTLLLAVFSSLLPSIVYHSTSFESHWSSSSEQLTTMRKLYFFLLFMVLILPSLGLTSIAGLLEWLIERFFHGTGTLRFACLFKPNQGVFVVNYVITAAFLGSVLELLRFPDLLVYIFRLIFARSAAERKYVKQDQAYASQYGSMYGWTLCVFTVITTYSIICPIITPFGLLFMSIRHFVDKHNLYSAYLPNPLNSHVHIEAINMVMAAPIICLLWLYFYFGVTSGFWSSIAIFTMVFPLITAFVCMAQKFFGYFKYLSPHSYKVKKEDREEVAEEEQEVYLPRVLHPEAPARTMIQQTDEAADCSLKIRVSPVAKNQSDSAKNVIHDLFEDAANSQTIRTSPVVEDPYTDVVELICET
ncbi:CSC1-like protein 2 isoform X2 [Paralichthys olivaceus]|uniref:CSC1-like protein 2 isoform X2 n=1 Tax=Paralichthys olivaceus TaxID=8255 RepID=UPI0037507490